MTTIETTEQAETLPVGTVLLDAKSIIYVRGFLGDDDLWDRPGRLGGTLADYINLPVTVLHDPTQPAPAGVTDREAAHLAGGKAYAEGGGPDDVVDAVLSVLPGRTVAQVKAEALREAAAGFRDCDEWPYRASRPRATEEYLNARADELEREDGR